jgi:hypothetical protein
MKTPKLYDSARHPEPASNFATVGNITLVVHQILADEVLFVINPDTQGFLASRSSQTMSFIKSDETQIQRLRLSSSPIPAIGAEVPYTVSLVEIGTESLPKVIGQLRYCIFDIAEA